MHRKLKTALQIIRKFHGPVNAKETEQDIIVYLYGLTKESIGSRLIEAAVRKAEKQPDYPANVHYQSGCLAYVEPKDKAETKEEPEPVIENKEPVIETLIETKEEVKEIIEEKEPEPVIEKPKKTRKKKSE